MAIFKETGDSETEATPDVRWTHRAWGHFRWTNQCSAVLLRTIREIVSRCLIDAAAVVSSSTFFDVGEQGFTAIAVLSPAC